MEASNTEKALLEVKALALYYGNDSLTLEALAKAVLVHPQSRQLLAKKLKTEERYLDNYPTISYEIPDNIEEIKWPEQLLKDNSSIFDHLNFDNMELDDDEEKKDQEDTEFNGEDEDEEFQKPKEVNDLNELVDKLTTEINNDFWFKKCLFEDLKDLIITLDKVFKVMIERYPYHRGSLLRLKKVFYSRITEEFDTEQDKTVQPIFIVTSQTNNVELLLKEIADQIGYNYQMICGNSDDSSFDLSDVKTYPLTLRVFRFSNSDYGINDSIKTIITYYETGIVNKQTSNWTGITSLFDDTEEDEESNLFKVEFILKKHISIYVMNIDPNILLNESMTTGEIINNIMHYYENLHKSYYCLDTWNNYRDICKLLSIAKIDNLVYYDQGCEIAKVEAALKYAQNLAENVSVHSIDITQDDVQKIVMLAILKAGEFNIQNIYEGIHNVFYDIKEKMILNNIRDRKTPLKYHSLSGSVERLLNRKPLQATEKNVIEHVKKEFFSHNTRISFSVIYDNEKAEMLIKDISAHSNIKEGSLIVQRPKVRFNDVVGYDDVKQRFRMIIEYYMNSDKYKSKNIKISNRILLYGPPGTGKTMMAQAFAGEIGYPYFAISAAEVTSQKYAGEGGVLLREMFEKAKRVSPSVLFLDELDAFSSRAQFSDEGGSVGHDARSIINSLLVLLDGFEDNSNVIVIGATNRPEDLDSALTRSKRFGLKFEMATFTAPDRENLIRKHLKPENCADDYEEIIQYLKSRTYGDFTAAKIADIVEEIKFYSIVEKQRLVNRNDIDLVIDKFVFGEKIKQLDPEFKKNTAFHEAGHAIVSRYLFPDNIIHRVSVGYRQSSVGITLWEEDDEKPYSFKNSDLVNHLCVCLAGMQAEKIKYGYWDLGSGGDMLTATKISTLLSTNIDLGHGLKPAIDYAFMSMGMSDESISLSIREIASELIEKCTAKTQDILQNNWNYVEALALELEKKEDLSWSDIVPIIKGLPYDKEPLIMPSLYNKIDS